MERPEHPTLGIIIPVHNEEPVLPQLLSTLEGVDFGVQTSVLFVDDGSKDGSLDILREACRQNQHYACISLSRNFGHHAAVTAGLRYCRGDAVAVLDADLQDPPELVVDFLRKWREGYDVVYGIRQDRKESLPLRFAYWAFYFLLNRVANVHIPRDAGLFALMDRRVVAVLNEIPEHNRYLPGLRGWAGFKQTGIAYSRPARQAGETSWNVRRLTALALDALLSFSTVPLRIASLVGAAAAVAGFGYLVFAIIVWMQDIPVEGWTSTVAIILVLGGLQLLVLGIMGEYIGRIFEDVKRRPLFVTRTSFGWARDAEE